MMQLEVLHKFKNLWFLYIGIILSALIATVFVYAYTFEGEMDPAIFTEWKVVEGSARFVDPTTVSMIVENPDESAKVKRIQIFVIKYRNTIVAYQYFKDGGIFCYYLKGDKYLRYYHTAEELKGCMKCHKDVGLHCSWGRG